MVGASKTQTKAAAAAARNRCCCVCVREPRARYTPRRRTIFRVAKRIVLAWFQTAVSRAVRPRNPTAFGRPARSLQTYNPRKKAKNGPRAAIIVQTTGARRRYHGRAPQRDVRHHGGGPAAERRQPGRPENGERLVGDREGRGLGVVGGRAAGRGRALPGAPVRRFVA